MQVNAETLREKIIELSAQPHLSIKEEYTLQAFFELCKRLQKEEERGGTRAGCHCNCQFWHYDESQEQCICNSCLWEKAHD